MANVNGTKAKENSFKNDKNEKQSLWVIEEYKSDSETSNKKETKKQKKKTNKKDFILDLDNIDRNFKLKKTIERLEDGSYVEVIKPEFVQQYDNESESENDNYKKEIIERNEREKVFENVEMKLKEKERETKKRGKKLSASSRRKFLTRHTFFLFRFSFFHIK